MDDGREEAYHVLVVEDNPGDRRFIEEALHTSPLDLTIHAVKTKAEALEVIDRRGEHEDTVEPDAVFLDWDLSKETGKEVLTAAKSGGSSIPVLVMTGSDPEVHPARDALSQADMFIEKPTEPEEYVEHLHSLLVGQ